MLDGNSYSFLVGSYTTEKSKGIYQVKIDSNGYFRKSDLVINTINPSFISFHEQNEILLTVNEVAEGRIESYKFIDETWTKVSAVDTKGAGPCFVNSDHKGNVFVANYDSGSVAYFKVDDDARLSNILFLQRHEGRGSSSRQEGPHAHSVYFMPGTNRIISLDLGIDKLLISEIKSNEGLLILDPLNSIQIKPASGPRHLKFHPLHNWIYVVHELSSTIGLYRYEEHKIQFIEEFSTLPVGFKGENTCAEITISKDGKFLYVSNRGHNSITIFSINLETGNLYKPNYINVNGLGPRHFVLTADQNFIVIANQYSNNLSSFKRNSENGLIEFVDSLEMSIPVYLLQE